MAQECVHSRSLNQVPGVVLKLDMEMAYDIVIWSVLMEIMRRMGFRVRWCNWIFDRLSSAHFSELYKGRPTKFFKASRGLRHGDPLSPFLFTLYAECFNLMIKNVVDRGNLSGFEIANNGLNFSHLQYTDDTLIFRGAKVEQVQNIATFLCVARQLWVSRSSWGRCR
ncbi:uncharacterized protein LOC110006538 [Amborella trichopoda]|uniref:uncharacterized protein LOC110006538 n=1 Tax=Amborella trichopoda TaxID=13333 RepID=UPI0009BE9F92|nr:uncharacterized protein LOC110006538 [Amborella trichopoda]|eukprot:XP_020517941.1 uncharacterized protein LOC110006538 [Amborella trichopoda]